MKKFKWLTYALILLLGGGISLASCGAEDSSSSSSIAHTHVFADGTYPCEDRTCLECGALIAATVSHNNELIKTVEPTCEGKGYSIYRCSLCGERSNGSYTSALGHDYHKGMSVESACDHVGYTEFNCSRCSNSYKEYVPAGEHEFDESLTKVTEPTCTHYGQTSKHCVTCDKDYVVSYSEPLGHLPTEGKDKVVTPTCTREGYSEHLCSRCGEAYQDSFLPKKEHDFKTLDFVDATCEHASYKKMACFECGLTKIVGGSEQKKAHSFDEDGVCSTCHKTYLSASFISFSKGDMAIPCLEDNYFDHLIYSEANEEPIIGKIGAEDVSYLLSKNVRSITLQLGSYVNESRSFTFELSSQKKKVSAVGANDNFDFERLATFPIALSDDAGNLSSNLVNGAVSFKLTHQKHDDEESDEAFSSFPVRYNLSARYSANDPSSYLVETLGESNVAYVEGKGYRLDYLKEERNNSFMVNLRKEVMQEQKEKGMTKMIITFADSFEGYKFEGFPYNCAFDMYAYKFVSGNESERERWKTEWIYKGEEVGTNEYAHTFEGLDQMDFSSNGVEMNFSALDPSSKFVGHVYIKSIAFEAEA